MKPLFYGALWLSGVFAGYLMAASGGAVLTRDGTSLIGKQEYTVAVRDNDYTGGYKQVNCTLHRPLLKRGSTPVAISATVNNGDVWLLGNGSYIINKDATGLPYLTDMMYKGSRSYKGSELTRERDDNIAKELVSACMGGPAPTMWAS